MNQTDWENAFDGLGEGQIEWFLSEQERLKKAKDRKVRIAAASIAAAVLLLVGGGLLFRSAFGKHSPTISLNQVSPPPGDEFEYELSLEHAIRRCQILAVGRCEAPLRFRILRVLGGEYTASEFIWNTDGGGIPPSFEWKEGEEYLLLIKHWNYYGAHQFKEWDLTESPVNLTSGTKPGSLCISEARYRQLDFEKYAQFLYDQYHSPADDQDELEREMLFSLHKELVYDVAAGSQCAFLATLSFKDPSSEVTEIRQASLHVDEVLYGTLDETELECTVYPVYYSDEISTKNPPKLDYLEGHQYLFFVRSSGEDPGWYGEIPGNIKLYEGLLLDLTGNRYIAMGSFRFRSNDELIELVRRANENISAFLRSN